MNKYTAFYKAKKLENVEAETALAARDKAAALFKARKAYDVTVVLSELGEKPGEPVIHKPLF